MLLVAAAVPQDAPPVGGAIAAREADWDALLAAGLDPRWLLPDAPRDARQPDLVREAEALLARDLAAGPGDPLRTLGDWVRALAPLADAPRERDARLRELLDARPALADVREPLEQLLRDASFRDARRWRPGKDRDDDGFWMGAAWDLRTEGRAPWSELEGATEAWQGATLVHADAAALLAAEQDLAAYDGHAGARYLRIAPRAFLRGADPDERPFAAVRTEFERDLPFPFGTYEYDLWTLYRVGGDGRLRAHVTTRSEDFHWLAGCDTHLPVATSDGELVALLVVRRFGFDLDGVPDGDGSRRDALREGLGNFKRTAEARAAARGGPLRPAEGVPAFVVRPPR